MENKAKTNLKNILMLTVSLIMGAAGVFLSKNFIDKKINSYKQANSVTEVMVQVVVPKSNMLRGQVVHGDNLAVREFPKKYMDSNVVTPAGYKIALGQRLNFDIDGGKPLLWAHLEGGLNPTFSGKIQDGYRALTMKVDQINSISGFLQPKDTVDLLLTYSGKETGGQKITMPLMQSLHVMATGVKTVVDKTGKSSDKSYNTITVQVTPEEAKRLTLAQDVGKITATLRHPEDELPMASGLTTVEDVLGRKKVAPAKRVVAPKKNGIEFIVGGV